MKPFRVDGWRFGAVFSIFLLLLPLGCGLSGEKWKAAWVLSVPMASWESLACRQGRLYLGFQDEAKGQANVLQLDNGVWAPLGKAGIPDGGFASHVALSVDPITGTPYLAYETAKIRLMKAAGEKKPLPQVSYQSFVQKFDGKAWKMVGSGPAGEDSPALAVHGGTAYLAHMDGGKAIVSKNTGYSWQKLGGKTLTETGYPYATGTFVDPDSGDVYTAVANKDKRWTFVARYDGKKWSLVGDNYVMGTLKADNGSLWVDHGNVYLAFHDVYRGGKATVVEYDGVQWKVLGKPGFSVGAVEYLSLVVDQGVPYLAYQDEWHEGKATVMRFMAGTWEPLGGAGISPGKATFESLALDDSTHTLYLAYKDLAHEGMASVLEYSLNPPVQVASK